MAERRIHIVGASGSGTSTLARSMATQLASQAFDTDDFFWRPTDPAFREKRPVRERLEMMEQVFLPRSDWILAGSFSGWGDPIIPRLTHVIFLTLPRGTRLARLRKRERKRYGDRIKPGGDQAGAFQSFLDWAMQYDDPNFFGRSRRRHEAWLEQIQQPVITLDAGQPIDVLTRQAVSALDHSPVEA